VLCQGCIKLRQELYQASINVKSAEEIIRILHDEINISRMVDATDRGASSMLSGKKRISSKTYFKDWAPILIDQYKRPKNMQRTDMIHRY